MAGCTSVGSRTLAIGLAGMLLAAPALFAQTTFKLAKNKYTPAQDVALGMKAAAQVRKEYPIIEEGFLPQYLARLGDGLVAAAPASLKQPEYRFSFTGVNLKEINAFALPGGPMFVNRGMIDAAKGEGEVAGVMAHELSHVLLRHGTANATKAENPWLQLGQVAGVVGGSMVGGAVGAIISDGTQFGLSTMLLRYSRDFEKQADLLGVAIMAKAGYDPRDLARMFETIARSGSGSPPEWLSSHPDPGNRSAYINKEAQAVAIGPAPDTREFASARNAIASLPAPITMAELARRRDPNTGTAASNAATGTPGLPVPAPSARMREISAGIFTADVPSNWTSLQSSSAIRVVPENGYGQLKGQTVFTHGVEFGVAKAASRDL
ncbi:MAG TPA: M48 family metallopeptidase, partial [Vicinamibacterales bacterium]|nr:M48 family metallopeptidase [Vicinamibacterales bacterium]